ncbi:MAG: hypothetical protein II921_07800 [Treponema sp.]|nr:hypothetical protein [Treponema sp.]
MAQKVSEAINNFSKKFARFKTQAEPERIKRTSRDEVLQEQINRQEERYEFAVIGSYNVYKSPLVALGKNSSRGKSIDEDEQSLMKAYKLFKAVNDANTTAGDKTTFIHKVEIESPIAKKDSYTRGGQFVFLQCWLRFEQRVEDFCPVLEEDRNGYFHLRFHPQNEVKMSAKDKELMEKVRESFY